MIIMIDNNFRVVRANSAAHITFGRSLNDRKLEEVIHDPLLFSFIKWVMHDKKGKDIELFLPELMGRHYIVRIEKFPVHSPGGISIIIVMHDVTEAKRSEQMFMDFVANASHEIRTPLTGIVGFIETLRTTAKDDPGVQEKFLGLMAQQAERMSKLVSDLLSLSKIEMNANTQPTETVDIYDILDSSRRQVDWSAKERHVEVKFDMQKNLPLVVGDANELIQVFSNLIGNAIKYGHSDSTITVRGYLTDVIPKDAINVKGIAKAVAVAVQDRGEGIPPEHIPRLTERFYRVDTGRSRKIGGTGLGLAIVKHIIKRHHGALNIESKLGEGSTFTVYLPVDEN
jgi:two-component system phosphate regulon sensor histidine kinase PhoR